MMEPTAINPEQHGIEEEIEISYVMPCLNEAETLLGCIEEAAAAIKSTGVKAEIVIADNGSSDGSQAIAEGAGARVVNITDKGYGNALIGGIQAAKGRYIIMGDADGSYDFSELPRFLEKLRAGYDLVMGCRLPRGGGTILPGAMPWKHRWIGNPVLSFLGRIFFRAPIDDFHCGLRAFRKEAILDLDLICTGMEFASEMVVKSTINKLKMDQVPITLRPDGRSRAPHLRSWRDGWRHLRFMLLFTPKWLFLYPGIFVTLLCSIGFATLLMGPLTIGTLTFDTNTLLVCSAGILVGLQAIFLAIFTKVYTVQQGLLRPDKRVKKLLDSHPVEWGLGLGFLIFLGGFIGLVLATLYWRGESFGQLSYSVGLRLVIPAVTAIAIGLMSMFSGFALSVLDLKRK